jgi:aspartyl-tRNA(Asn)/glutamyl-tRNA(Gln) amidotransferase subunit A
VNNKYGNGGCFILELYRLTIHEAHALLKDRQISSEELIKAILDRIQEVDKDIKAYVTLDIDNALQASRSIDKIGDFSEALTGIPVAIKDNICTKGLKTTCSSKMLADFIPPYDATVCDRLKSKGSVFIGKTNMDEFAMGSSTENSAFFATKNPWDLKRVPGGSSGGSAAAVAADECIFALGSDTGGSVRQPAASCGVVGLKPTYGRVSRYGLIALAPSLEQIGPMTKDVKDCAIVMNAISGIDPLDATSVNGEIPDYMEGLAEGVKGAKIGLPKEYLGEWLDSQVRDAVLSAAKLFEDLGATCEEVSLPHTDYALWAYHIVASAEASSSHGQYDGIRYGMRADEYDDLVDLYKKTRGEGFGPEVKRRIILGTYVMTPEHYEDYYLKAQKVRTLVKNDFDRILRKYDFFIAPTAPEAAFKLGEEVNDPYKMYMNDLYTVPANMAGLPSISVPCGFSDGMPIGLQIIGKHFDEAMILKAAYALEQAAEIYTKRPMI